MVDFPTRLCSKNQACSCVAEKRCSVLSSLSWGVSLVATKLRQQYTPFLSCSTQSQSEIFSTKQVSYILDCKVITRHTIVGPAGKIGIYKVFKSFQLVTLVNYTTISWASNILSNFYHSLFMTIHRLVTKYCSLMNRYRYIWPYIILQVWQYTNYSPILPIILPRLAFQIFLQNLQHSLKCSFASVS